MTRVDVNASKRNEDNKIEVACEACGCEVQ